jgi:hypothetical protein
MQRNIIRCILCSIFVVACSPPHSHLKERLSSGDITGTWYSTQESIQRLTSDANLRVNNGPFSIELLSSGECRFLCYSTAARRLLNETATWQIDHDVTLDSKNITNVLWISFADGRTIERLFIDHLHGEVTLWCDVDNGWGDSFAITHTRSK